MGSTCTALKHPDTGFLSPVGRLAISFGMLQKLSESGVLLESHPPLPEGASLEMIFEMPQEITGQAYSRVLCRGEVVRSIFEKSGIPLVGVTISGYRFLLEG